MGRIDQDPRERELDELVRAGQFERAAGVARALGQPRYAARLFADGQLPYQSAVCFYEAGEPAKALAAFLAVPKNDARYRAACVHALRIASELNSLSRELDAYVAEFASSDPTNPHEVRALYRLGVLYQENELFDHARDALRRVVRVDPANADAKQRVTVLDGLVRGAPSVYEAILRQDASDWRAPAPAHLGAPKPPGAGEPRSLPVRLPKPPVPQAGGPLGGHSPAPGKSPRPPPARSPVPPPASSSEESWSVASADIIVEPTLVSRTSPAEVPVTELPPETLVAGRYKVEEEVGRGGMGIVYRAVDLELDEAVAIKVFSNRLDEEGLLHRFKQELTLCRQLAHPNIVRLYDIGAHAGRKFITMELLQGASLREVLKERRPSLGESVNMLRQICAGLGAAHAVGIVHRDVKPDNLFVTTSGLVKLTDFGLAKRQGDPDSHTMVGFMGGSPNYMAPEQITDFGAVTRAADLYSVGIVAYELVTGTKPFRDKERQKVLEMHLTLEPAPPSAHVPGLPRTLDRLILDLLRKRPTERPPSCEDVLARLEVLESLV
jgi:eukaryotic-like serine/threonine-protein kinase